MRTAIVHYWLVTWRGGEQVLKVLSDMFPEADIYTHVAVPELLAKMLPNRNVYTTFINDMPFSKRLYQRYLPLMPLALEQLDLSKYDLVISSESGPAKGVIVSPYATHICYCHSPMRYVWDQYHAYREEMSALTRLLSAPLFHYVRNCDQLAALRVDRFVANSQFVAKRIEKYYRRSAHVVHPPVAVSDFDASQRSEEFYLWVGQLVKYKRPDIAVRAFNALNKKLIVIGDGPLFNFLKRSANRNVTLMGRQPFDVIRDHYARCRAVIFPGVEDFGIVPVEAMASGKPVIAFNYGGASETVVNEVTGLFFDSQTTEGLVNAVKRFERCADFDSETIRKHAESYSTPKFIEKFRAVLETAGVQCEFD